ncbi:protein of unknown function [Methylotuvimicrobium alcaliphilum 20Z]|uniref:Uncharacterized protein n=1 Tax=Methylotuvimicrobium alcaliphilum (strain DSM 19304 / NCIMB 14124 / VKM B-2133 / 20Z) TaxID=1091494 RepID=G4SY29_META2|nr:protein of unknown function [Methylotuvimicrobium alcaliphilum 20Z]
MGWPFLALCAWAPGRIFIYEGYIYRAVNRIPALKIIEQFFRMKGAMRNPSLILNIRPSRLLLISKCRC